MLKRVIASKHTLLYVGIYHKHNTHNKSLSKRENIDVSVEEIRRANYAREKKI